VRMADEIIVLDRGTIRERGSHEELVQQFITGQSSGPMETPGF